MDNPIHDSHHIPSTAAWLAEGQSSQRDMLDSLQALKDQSTTPFSIIASHRHNRPEIFEFADKVYYEPFDTTANTDKKSDAEPVIPRWKFVLEHACQNHTKVLLTGRNNIAYEEHREEFDAAGIRLLTGATSVDALKTIDDKFAFMQQCHQHDIPVAHAWRFDNIAELKDLLAKHGHQPLCIKPVTGIFAQGFWQLDSGQEYSIDVVCEYGEVLAAVTRYKTGKIQHIGYEQSVMDVVIPLIQAFGCDGIVSVQTKADENGQHRVLEINSRPSGGIGYTTHSGVDLTKIGFAYWLGLTEKPKLADIAKQIIPCQVRAVITGVKIEESTTE